MRRLHRHLLALTLLALTAAGAGTVALSSAGFTSSSVNPGSVFSSGDWTAPAVSLSDPGSPLQGSVALSATASDAESAVASVRIQRAPAGGTAWTDVCTRTVSPYSCTWATGDVADGRYDLRAVATDGAGNTGESARVRDRLVDNTAPTVTLTHPGANVRGTITLSASADDGAGSGIRSVRIERAIADGTTWTAICSDSDAPYSCTLDTTTLANDIYDLRAVATDNTGKQTISALAADVQVDNAAPAVTMSDPGSPLSGTITLAATASDADSGVERVVISYAPSGSGQWTEACVDTTSPYSCRLDTTTAATPDGDYDFRATATDLAGNRTISATVAKRRIDNSQSSISLEDPGAHLRGTVALSANAYSRSGITSVTIQRAPAGKTQWTDVCVDTTSPYGCDWDTTKVADGLYDLRATMVAGGLTYVSSVVSGRRVDNSPVRGVDVQTANKAGGTAGRAETGDSLTLTWSHAMQPGSLISGWSGTSAATVYVAIEDGAKAGTGSGTLDVARISADAQGKTAVGLADLSSVHLGGNYVRSNKAVVFTASAALSSETVDGVARSVVTITLGAQSGGGLRTWTTPTAMTWNPSAAARDLTGLACSTAPVTETGALDADF